MSEHENVTIKHSSDGSSDLRQLVKDLSDLKFELETQKEELIRSRAETKESLELYENLYDYAPVGYLTLAKKKNKILRANLTAAKIFGVDRTNILGDFFDRFIGVEYLSVFYAMLERAFTNRKTEYSDCILLNDNQTECWFHLVALVSDEDECRLTLTDINEHIQALAKLKANELRYRSMFVNHAAIMLIFDPVTGSILEANHSAIEFYGWSAEELYTMKTSQINTHSFEEINKATYQCVSGEKNHFITHHRRADGSIRVVESYTSTIELIGKPLLFSIIHDITERMGYEIGNAFHLSILQMLDTTSIQEVLKKTLDEAEKLTESSFGIFYFLDEDETSLSFQACSTNTEKIIDRSIEKTKDCTLDEAGVWADAVRERKQLILNDDADFKSRKRISEGYGEVQREIIIPIIENEKVIGLMGVGNKPSLYNQLDLHWLEVLAGYIRDIIAKKVGKGIQDMLKKQNLIIEQLALHDSLTGLPNRRLLSERISLSLAQCRRNKSMAALMIFDLDKFKPVNDTLGHAIGDILLQQVAVRTRETLLRSSDSIARLGGDEFVVLLPQIAAISNAVAIAEKIQKKIKEPYTIEGHTIDISCSIGIAVFPDHGENELTLMKHADDAMYHAKHQGRDKVKVFQPCYCV